MSKYIKAINEKILYGFTIKPIGLIVDSRNVASNIDTPVASGHLMKTGDMVLLKTEIGFDRVVRFIHLKMEVNFIINRHTFQQQHNAMDWFYNHSLYSTLIENPLFKSEPSPIELGDYTFW